MTEEEARQKYSDYCSQLLENVADEVNIKQVVFPGGSFSFDTISRKSVGFGGDYLPFMIELFSGDVIDDMETVRALVSYGLGQRSKAGIKVRQPLQSLTIA